MRVFGKRLGRVLSCCLLLAAVAVFAVFAGGGAENSSGSAFPDPSPVSGVDTNSGTSAVFAGGCFWGVEAVFESLIGVENVVSGYAGGEAENARYNLVSSGTTGHAESVLVTFDPEVISYETLLKVFFSIAHDPTQLNYQGPDHGPQYRSAIFFMDEGQKAIAEEYIALLNDAKVYSDPIVTEITEYTEFYQAEPYHQDFMVRNPDYPYIVYWDRPKIEALNYTYPELVKR